MAERAGGPWTAQVEAGMEEGLARRAARCRLSECGQPQGRAARPVPAGVQQLENDPLQRGAHGAEEAQGAHSGGGPAGARLPRGRPGKDHPPRGGPGSGQLSIGGRTPLPGLWGPGEPAGRGRHPAAPALRAGGPAGSPARLCPGTCTTLLSLGSRGTWRPTRTPAPCCQLHGSRSCGEGEMYPLCPGAGWGVSVRQRGGTRKYRGCPGRDPSPPSPVPSIQVGKRQRGQGTCPGPQGSLGQLGGVPTQRG